MMEFDNTMMDWATLLSAYRIFIDTTRNIVLIKSEEVDVLV